MDNKINVDFGGWIQKGFDVWKDNLLTLIISYVIMAVVSGISFGILAGPMYAGYVAMLLALHDKTQPKPQIGDLFKGFSMFLPAFLLCLLMGAVGLVLVLFFLIPCIGWIVGPILAIAASTLMMFAMFNLVDKKMSVVDALKASIMRVKEGFFPFLGLFIVATAIGGAGSLLCGIGSLATMPIMFCILTAAYRAIEGGGPVQQTPPPVTPPVAS